MAPATLPKPGDKRQRSIADMFGVKPQSATSTITTTSSTASVSSSLSNSNALFSSATPTTSKTKPKKPTKTSTLLTPGRLARVSYQKLQPVDPEAYHHSLSADFKDLLALELNPDYGLGSSYLRVLRSQLTQQYFLDLKRFLLAEGLAQPRNDIYPSAQNIYHWSRATPLDQIRVVVIGQDPYHGPGQAHGLSFSVPKGIPIPGSLRNIHEELKREYPDFKKPNHGSLRSWAQSGVLLLNTSLTVKKAQAGSHSNKGWEQFTDAIVDAIDLYGGLGLLEDGFAGEEAAEPEHISKRMKVDKDAATNETDNSLSDPKGTSSEKATALDRCEPVSKNTENLLTESKAASPDVATAALGISGASSSEHATVATEDAKLTSPKQETAPQESKPSSNHPTPQTTKPGFGKGVVFLCWGKWAADRVARLSDSKHLILKSAHPSPLSAHRGFLGNNHFTKANEWLESRYGKSAMIDWCRLNPE